MNMIRHSTMQLRRLPNIHNLAFPQQKINPAVTDRGNINKPYRYQSTYSSTIPLYYTPLVIKVNHPYFTSPKGMGPSFFAILARGSIRPPAKTKLWPPS